MTLSNHLYIVVSVYISAVIMKPNQAYLLSNQYVIVKKLEELFCYQLLVLLLLLLLLSFWLYEI